MVLRLLLALCPLGGLRGLYGMQPPSPKCYCSGPSQKTFVYDTAKVYVQAPPPHSPLLWEAGGCFFGLRTDRWNRPLSRPVWRGWALVTALLGTLMNCLSICEGQGSVVWLLCPLPRPFVWGLHLALCLGEPYSSRSSCIDATLRSEAW